MARLLVAPFRLLLQGAEDDFIEPQAAGPMRHQAVLAWAVPLMRVALAAIVEWIVGRYGLQFEDSDCRLRVGDIGDAVVAMDELVLRQVAGKGSTRVKNLFKYFNSFMDAERNGLDALILDEAHRIREKSVNRYTPKALRERALANLKPLDRSERLKDVAKQLQEGESVHKVKRLLLNADGQVVPVLLSARSIEVDGESCGIFTFIDMSELETARREQRETQERLSSTIREHAAEKLTMKRLALTDSLTGIANRRALNTRLSEERSRALRYNDTFSILVLDLDRFKSLNDTFGHAAGDEDEDAAGGEQQRRVPAGPAVPQRRQPGEDLDPAGDGDEHAADGEQGQHERR